MSNKRKKCRLLQNFYSIFLLHSKKRKKCRTKREKCWLFKISIRHFFLNNKKRKKCRTIRHFFIDSLSCCATKNEFAHQGWAIPCRLVNCIWEFFHRCSVRASPARTSPCPGWPPARCPGSAPGRCWWCWASPALVALRPPWGFPPAGMSCLVWH